MKLKERAFLQLLWDAVMASHSDEILANPGFHESDSQEEGSAHWHRSIRSRQSFCGGAVASKRKMQQHIFQLVSEPDDHFLMPLHRLQTPLTRD